MSNSLAKGRSGISEGYFLLLLSRSSGLRPCFWLRRYGGGEACLSLLLLPHLRPRPGERADSRRAL
jgi:hypothetical protein